MSRRSESYDADIAKEMQDPEFARGMVLHALGSGDSVEDALKYAIQRMGVKEFAEQSGLSIQNVSAFINGKRRFGFRNLSRCLAVFGLKFVVARDDEAA